MKKKEKLVVVDLWGSLEHRAINQKYIDYIEKFRDISLICPKNILIANNADSEVFSIDGQNKNKGKILNRLQYIKNIIKISSKIEHEEVFVLCYDIITFYIFFLLNKKRKITLFQHQHIKQLDKKVHKFIFSIYKNKVRHIVLEESFRSNFIKKIELEEKNVFVCSHPLFEKLSDKNKSFSTKRIISISNSYDKSLMSAFLNVLKKKSFKEKIFFRIRNKEEQYKLKDILVENKIYDYSEIQEMYEEANISIILANKENFKDRVSGTIFDAISKKCFILSNKFDFSIELEKRYPNLIETFETIEELVFKIENKKLEDSIKDYDNDLARFYNDYSEEKIILELKKVF